MEKWQQAADLLSQGHYQRVGQILQVQQEAAQRSGQLATAVFLAAAGQLCLTCLQFRAERELHQLGLDEASRREQELRQQVQVVLSLLSHQALPETKADLDAALNLPLTQTNLQEPEDPHAEAGPKLLRKIQHLLGFESASAIGKREANAEDQYPRAEQAPVSPTAAEEKISSPAGDGEEMLPSSQPLEPDKPAPALSPAERKMLQAAIDSLTGSRPPAAEGLPAIDPEALVLESQKAKTADIEEELETEAIGASPEIELLQSVIKSMEVEASAPDSSLLSPEDELLVIKAEKELHQRFEKDDFSGVSHGEVAEPKTIYDEREGEEFIPGKKTPEPAGPLVSPSMANDKPEMLHETGDLNGPSLVVYCLGPFQLYLNNEPIEHWPSSKGKSIFKYLITHRHHPVAKEILMDLFWPGSDPDAARNNLNVAIYGLRQAFRDGDKDFSHVIYRNECYLLNPELQVWLDIEEFMARYGEGQKLEQRGLLQEAIQEYHTAEALYQGEFLAEDRYEEWLIPLRQQLVSTYLDLLERLSQFYFERHEYTSSITICRAMLTSDPCREDAHAKLMLCYDRLGQRHLALRQYHHCVMALNEELEVEPTPYTVALYEEIRRHDTG